LRQAERSALNFGGKMIRLIPLENRDLDRIMEIERKSFSSNTWEEKEVYERRISTFPQGNLGIWQEDKLIGFICSELWKFEEKYEVERFMLSHNIEDYHNLNGNELYISSFAIDKEFSSKGLGKLSFVSFFLEMQEKFKITSSILLVSDEWIGAKNIYLQNGYSKIGLINEFFINDNGEKFDGIIMRKSDMLYLQRAW